MERDYPRYKVPALDEKPSSAPMSETTPWGISRIYENNGVPRVPRTNYFPNIIVRPMCVIDDGYDLLHSDLRNAVNAGNNANDITTSCGKHGSHVAGTVGAIGGNEKGVIGVFPNLPGMKFVKVFGTLSCNFVYSSDLIGAAQDCRDSGAKIIHMSLGSSAYSSVEADAFQSLTDNDGMLLIAGAGNNGDDSFLYPASYDSVMSVAATNATNKRASFSQYNGKIEIAGPGVDILSTVPFDKYEELSGTSMASSHVAGAAVVLWNKHPTRTNAQIRNALNKGAVDLGVPGKDDEFGNGLLNYWNSDKLLADCSETEYDAEDPMKTIVGVLTANKLVYSNCGMLQNFKNYKSSSSVCTRDRSEALLSSPDVCALDPASEALLLSQLLTANVLVETLMQ
jgi:serine protease